MILAGLQITLKNINYEEETTANGQSAIKGCFGCNYFTKYKATVFVCTLPMCSLRLHFEALLIEPQFVKTATKVIIMSTKIMTPTTQTETQIIKIAKIAEITWNPM